MKIWDQRNDNNSLTINIHAPCISIPQTFYILVCCCNVYSAFNMHDTVELPNNGQVGSGHFVLYMEVVLSQKFCLIALKINSNNTFRY